LKRRFTVQRVEGHAAYHYLRVVGVVNLHSQETITEELFYLIEEILLFLGALKDFLQEEYLPPTHNLEGLLWCLKLRLGIFIFFVLI
jgi:hypothetical protein